jgi:hypothetical protein
MGAPDAALTKLQEDANLRNQQYKVAMEDYMNPKMTTPTNIVMAYTRSQVAGAGRMNNVEIQRNLAAGGFGEALKNKWMMATKGTMDRKLMRDMVEEMRTAAKASTEVLDSERKRREEGTVLGERDKTAPDNLPKAKVPPKNQVDGMAEGQWIHGPDGTSYQKKGGKLVDKDGNPVEVN